MIGLKEIQPNSKVKKISAYRKFNPRQYALMVKYAATLKKKKILHINSTFQGGGVAELLNSQIKIERLLGLDSRWYAIQAPKNFFEITKKLHNALQGSHKKLKTTEIRFYKKINKELSCQLLKILKDFKADIIILHDPQPMPIIDHLPPEFKCISRLHIDFSEPEKQSAKMLQMFLQKFRKIILSEKKYINFLQNGLNKKCAIISPAIDPLSEKNLPMAKSEASRILSKFNIPIKSKIITQVSRFDPWKDPEGVIKAYLGAYKEIPDIKLILAGFSLAKDDPQAEIIYKKLKIKYGANSNIFMFSNPKILKDIPNNKFISALYSESEIVLQKSLREGFGLTITEAMWKGKAVIAGKTPGTMLQIKNHKNGIIVDSPQQAAKAIILLDTNKALCSKLGKNAKKSVQQKFLMPRYIYDNLKIYVELLNS